MPDYSRRQLIKAAGIAGTVSAATAAPVAAATGADATLIEAPENDDDTGITVECAETGKVLFESDTVTWTAFFLALEVSETHTDETGHKTNIHVEF